jgi:ribosomal protein S18
LNDKNAAAYIKKLEMTSSENILKTLNIQPLKEFKNTSMLSHFITEMGHIKPNYKTGLDAAYQRQVSKAIKRARAMGLLPYTYRLTTSAN